MAVTIKDIAKKTGLGLATISKYINGGNVRENNRVLIESAIDELDFTVNAFAQGLKSNRSKTIGVVIPELNNIFIATIISAVEEILRQNGYSVIVCDCHTDEKLECEAVQFLIHKMVDGIINMSVCKDGKHLYPAVTKNIPVILIDRTIPELSGKVNAVLIDNAGAAEAATTYLLNQGHRNIGILVGPRDVYTSERRLLGYRYAFDSFHLSPPEDLIVCSDYTVQGGYECMRSWLSEHPETTATFITNYEMTLGAMIAVNELGIRVPDQVSVIGFDNLGLSQVIRPKLTIIEQPLEDIAKHTAGIMLDKLSEKSPSNPKTITLGTTLLVGESVKRI